MKYQVLSSAGFLELTRAIIGIQQGYSETLSYRMPDEILIRQRLSSVNSREPGFLFFCESMEKYQGYLTSPLGLIQFVFEALEITTNKLNSLPVALVDALPKYIRALTVDDQVFAADTVDWLETFRNGS